MLVSGGGTQQHQHHNYLSPSSSWNRVKTCYSMNVVSHRNNVVVSNNNINHNNIYCKSLKKKKKKRKLLQVTVMMKTAKEIKTINNNNNKMLCDSLTTIMAKSCYHAVLTGLVAAATVILSTSIMFSGTTHEAIASAATNTVEDGTTMENIPQMLSSTDGDDVNGKRKGRIQKPKSRKAETCTSKCVTTCVRGGYGAPGEGPLNAVRPLVVFKQGFRSRQYCLVECSDICNLIKD
ncbi:hypothetical protein C5167_015610 [Papaver somniferum]|uniref:Uncharacterized protein n=1 Tax=Papaver somniferum TaxID=3469 RepID=A0A4Y7J6J4_PAPSO|nr:uncharacterized protein LOC113358671 [Papaver somniferum]XP_026458077.1 uncharacterized protein LOC113358671 [Papaver somniferum]RZC56754.1 hypothetical protein C5167_015610 [Papaver somniferum]